MIGAASYHRTSNWGESLFWKNSLPPDDVVAILENRNVFVKREQRKLAYSAERRKGRIKSNIYETT